MIQSFVRVLWLLIGWIELSLFTLLLYILSYVPNASRGPWFRHAFRIWCSTWMHALGVDLRLHQKNANPLPKRFILIANHPSSLEDVAIPALFDVDCLAKQELRDWWLVGRIGAAAGTLFVKRDSKESRADAAEAIQQRLAAGRNIALYPEGGIKGPRLQSSFRYGAFRISLQTGIPIVPIYLHYEAVHDFHWARHSLLRNLRQIMLAQNNRANYYQFDAIYPQFFEDPVEFCNHVYRLYEQWQSRFLD